MLALALFLIACDHFPVIAVVNRTDASITIVTGDDEPELHGTPISAGRDLSFGFTKSEFPLRVRAVRSDGAVIFDRTYALEDLDGRLRLRVVVE